MEYGNWEKRWHPLRREWVVYAAHRNNRPWNFEKKESGKPAPAYDPDCYLCPGNKRVNGIQNPAYDNVFVFENGKVIQKEVTTGIQDENFIEIKSGLKDGEEIVVAPYSAISKKLKNNSTVKKVSKDELFSTEK